MREVNRKMKLLPGHTPMDQDFDIRTSGFTLIEILVGLTIISLLFGYGFVSYRDFTRRQNLSSLGKQIQGDLRLAQSNATSGLKPDVSTCDSTYVLDNYGVNIIPPSTYEIFATCSKVGVKTTINTKTVELPTGLSVSAPSINPLTFKVLGQGNNIPSGQTVTLTVTQDGTNATHTVTVTPGGEIK